MSTEEKKYPPARVEELAAAIAYLRNREEYAKFMSPKKALRIDWFLLRAIDREVAKRRTPKSKLMFLTGTVVREFVPDVDKETRELGKAYKSAMHRIFEDRKQWQKTQQSVKATEHPVDEEPGQFRLT